MLSSGWHCCGNLSSHPVCIQSIGMVSTWRMPGECRGVAVPVLSQSSFRRMKPISGTESFTKGSLGGNWLHHITHGGDHQKASSRRGLTICSDSMSLRGQELLMMHRLW